MITRDEYCAYLNKSMSRAELELRLDVALRAAMIAGKTVAYMPKIHGMDDKDVRAVLFEHGFQKCHLSSDDEYIIDVNP